MIWSIVGNQFVTENFSVTQVSKIWFFFITNLQLIEIADLVVEVSRQIQNRRRNEAERVRV